MTNCKATTTTNRRHCDKVEIQSHVYGRTLRIAHAPVGADSVREGEGGDVGSARLHGYTATYSTVVGIERSVSFAAESETIGA